MRFALLFFLLSFSSHFVLADSKTVILKHQVRCFQVQSARKPISIQLNIKYNLNWTHTINYVQWGYEKNRHETPNDCRLEGAEVICPGLGIRFTVNSSLRAMTGTVKSGFFKHPIECVDSTMHPSEDYTWGN